LRVKPPGVRIPLSPQKKNKIMSYKSKKPDLVVWDEDRGYYAKSLTYGTNISAPKINLEDVGTWKQKSANKVNQLLKTKYDEIIDDIKKLSDDYKWNELIFKSKYSFQPIIGNIYHLYLNKDGFFFLSLIEPDEWKQKYIGSFRLDSTEKWIKI
jgi:hypothetical protein